MGGPRADQVNRDPGRAPVICGKVLPVLSTRAAILKKLRTTLVRERQSKRRHQAAALSRARREGAAKDRIFGDASCKHHAVLSIWLNAAPIVPLSQAGNLHAVYPDHRDATPLLLDAHEVGLNGSP